MEMELQTERSCACSISIHMDIQSIQDYLHTHIPLSAAMQVRVDRADDFGVQLSAPLGPNINHRDSVFGGSLSALAILSAWTYLHRRLTVEGLPARLVIQRNTVEYEEPALGGFSAMVNALPETDWLRFAGMLQRKGKARITIQSFLSEIDGDVGIARFEGQFVAIKQDDF